MNEIVDILDAIRDLVIIAASSIPEKKRGPVRPHVPYQDTVKVMLMHA